MAQMLLVHKTDIEARKEENQTCSYVAASNNSKEVVQLMLGRTKGIKARDGYNEIPLQYAVLHNSAETRRRLLGYNVDMEAWKEKMSNSSQDCMVRQHRSGAAVTLI